MRTVREIVHDERTPQTACLAAAMGLHLSWTDVLFSGQLLPSGLQAITYGVSAICLAVVLFALSMMKDEGARALSKPAVRLVVACGLSLATLGMRAVYAGTLPVSFAAAVACGVATGILSALLFAAIGLAFKRADGTVTVVASIAGYLAYAVLPTVLSLTLHAFAPIVAAAMPLAAALFLSGAPVEDMPAVGADEGSFDARTRETSKVERSATWRFIACVALIAFVNELTRTVNGSAVVETVDRYVLVTASVQMLISLVCIVGMYFMFARIKGAIPFLRCYRGFMFLSVATLLFPLMPTDGNSPSAAAFLGIHLAIYTCLGCFSWLVAMKICEGLPDVGMRLLFRLFSLQAAASIAGIWCGNAVLFVLGVTSAVQVALAISIILLLAGYLLVFPESNLVTLVKLAQPKGDGPFIEACRAVIRDYGLSKREGEIMVMLGKGRNRAYICEQLVISKSTVSMHRQHIYRKLDIHSQQELINLIDQTKRNLNGAQ